MASKPYDHRDTEYGLQAAVAYAVHKGALGNDLMVVHGKRARAHPDIAAISSEEALTLVELKRRTASESDALQELCQIADYTLSYQRESVATLATWYCHSRVESLCGLELSRRPEGPL